jgi:hypothetical protein
MVCAGDRRGAKLLLPPEFFLEKIKILKKKEIYQI